MKKTAAKLTWGVEQRLEFIEFRLFWQGGVNRSSIIDMFGVSVPQASKDLSLYQEIAPKNAVYNKNRKRYEPSLEFAPIFLKPDPDEFLKRLRATAEGIGDRADSSLGEYPTLDVPLLPTRQVSTPILRMVLKAVREDRTIDLLYQSMSANRPEPVVRTISPHAFGFDGFRWHARAFCHIDCVYRDFLLPRMLEVRGIGEGESAVSSDGDDLWNQFFELVIAPNPQLTASQRAVVARDYSMASEQKVLTVRQAMLFYTMKQLGLLEGADKKDPRHQHIVAVNSSAANEILSKTDLPDGKKTD